MFLEFTPIKGSLMKEEVNTFLGCALLGSVALWAALFIFNVTSGSNPLDHVIAAVIARSVETPQ